MTLKYDFKMTLKYDFKMTLKYMLSLFLSLGFPYQMIVPKWQKNQNSYVYALLNNKNMLTVGSMFEQDVICDLKYPSKWLNSRADW